MGERSDISENEAVVMVYLEDDPLDLAEAVPDHDVVMAVEVVVPCSEAVGLVAGGYSLVEDKDHAVALVVEPEIDLPDAVSDDYVKVVVVVKVGYSKPKCASPRIKEGGIAHKYPIGIAVEDDPPVLCP